jgi:hypothetical protein
MRESGELLFAAGGSGGAGFTSLTAALAAARRVALTGALGIGADRVAGDETGERKGEQQLSHVRFPSIPYALTPVATRLSLAFVKLLLRSQPPAGSGAIGIGSGR